MKLTGFLFAAALLGACTQPAAEENYTRHVDPMLRAKSVHGLSEMIPA